MFFGEVGFVGYCRFLVEFIFLVLGVAVLRVLVLVVFMGVSLGVVV